MTGEPTDIPARQHAPQIITPRRPFMIRPFELDHHVEVATGIDLPPNGRHCQPARWPLSNC
jgi:hypothetical protein